MTRATSKRRKKTSPIFGELAESETDSWWKGLFQDLADGVFPHRVSYTDSTLFFKTRSGKYVRFHMIPNDPKLAIQLKAFFSETVGLIPSTYFDWDGPEEELGILTFKDMQKYDIVRRIAVYNYLSKQDLTQEEFIELQREIWWGFINKRWNQDTFLLEENRIVEFNPDEVNKKPTKKAKAKKKSI